MSSQSATPKDGAEIKEHVTKVVKNIETIVKNQCQSGHNANGDEKLKESRK